MEVLEFSEQKQRLWQLDGRREAECLDPARLAGAKRSFATRRVDLCDAVELIQGPVAPRAGDLVLARVGRRGQHTGLQLPDGRRARIFPGDEIIVAYGARYAPNQFESVVPQDLGPCHLVAAGGMASQVISKHRSMKRATKIEPIGLLADRSQRVINLRDYALPRPNPATGCSVPVIAVAGTAMDAGKTTAASALILGLKRAGYKVGAAKVTGTGACGDYFFYQDSGAEHIIDFTDFGYGSTYGITESELVTLFSDTVLHLQEQDVDVIVLEIADGLLQQETEALLRSDSFARLIDSMIFCAPDALGAMGGVEWLEHQGLHVSAIAGSLTAAPLAVKEAQGAIRLPVLTRAELSDASGAATILSRLVVCDHAELRN